MAFIGDLSELWADMADVEGGGWVGWGGREVGVRMEGRGSQRGRGGGGGEVGGGRGERSAVFVKLG